MQQLIEKFDLTKCSKSGARFDYVKGQWFNREYLLQKPDAEWAPPFVQLLKANGIEATLEQAEAVVSMMKMKVIEYDTKEGKKKRNISFISDLWPLCRFFFVAPQAFDPEDKFIKKNWKPESAADMQEMADILRAVTRWDVDGLKAAIDPWVEATGKKPWNAWRVCLVGTGQGPDMNELATFLGQEETLRRMAFAIAHL